MVYFEFLSALMTLKELECLIVAAKLGERGEDSHQVAFPLRQHASGHRDAGPNLSTLVQHLDRRA